ncbi:MAG: alpha-amylase family glycosyl hydrolase [Ignavibacteriaceae bacterium]
MFGKKFSIRITFSILVVILSSTVFAQKITTVVHPEWSKNASIYEVNIRQYTPEGTFKAFQKHIPEIKKMGIEIIWIMPINPIGEKNRKGTLGSYYSVKDYRSVNPEFGTLDDFKNLVNEIHKEGMHVILDWVANHTSWDNVLTKTHPDFYKKDSLGNFIAPASDWTDVIALNYNNPALWIYMESTMEYWIKESGIDGFRCDVADMVPTPFWNFVRKELEKIKPVFMLAEAENPGLQKHAFDMTYAWEFHNILKEIYKGKMTVTDLDKYYAREEEKYNPDAYRMDFTTNHDENSWNGTVFQRFGDAVKTFAVLCGVAKGMPLVYSGQESGMNKALRFFDKDTIEWKKSSFRDLYTMLIHLKLNNKALWNGISGGKMERIKTNNDDKIFSFVREKDNNKIFAIFNLSAQNQNIKVNDNKIEGTYKDLFADRNNSLSSDFNIELPSWGYKIFVK